MSDELEELKTIRREARNTLQYVLNNTQSRYDELILEKYLKPLVELTGVRTPAVEELAYDMKYWYLTVDELRTDSYLSESLDKWVRLVQTGKEEDARHVGDELIEDRDYLPGRERH